MMNVFLIFRHLQKKKVLEKSIQTNSSLPCTTENNDLYYKDVAGIAIFAIVAFFVLAIALFTN